MTSDARHSLAIPM